MSAPATIETVARQLADLTAVVQGMRAAVPSIMLDLQAAADAMGISTRQLRRLIADDAVPYRRLGRSLRFPMAKPRV